MDYGLIIELALIPTFAAAAWGGTRQALNGTRERVKGISNTLDKHIEVGNEQHVNICERMTAVETKIDHLV